MENKKASNGINKLLKLVIVGILLISPIELFAQSTSNVETSEEVGTNEEESTESVAEESENEVSEENLEQTEEPLEESSANNVDPGPLQRNAVPRAATGVLGTIPTANEVAYTEVTTAYVTTPEQFRAAHRNVAISRIVMQNNITLTTTFHTPYYYLDRDLLIDGQGNTLTINMGFDGYGFQFAVTATPKTFHMKNVKIRSNGTNLIDDAGAANRGINWQFILDDFESLEYITFANRANEQAGRVIRSRRAHVFLRNTVTMYSVAENFYIGQITVEENANVYGEINYQDYSTWWFQDAASQGSMNVGQGAYVSLNGIGGTSYPVIYEHFREINLHEDSTLIARKPGNALRFNNTSGVTDKYIRVAPDATVDAASTSGSNPSLNTVGQRGHFIAYPGSKVYFIGSNTGALIDMSVAGSSFQIESPESYDIRNNNKAYRAVTVGSGAEFRILNSDIEVWNIGAATNLDGNPNSSWFKSIGVIASSTGAALTGSDPALMPTWNTTQYARITGINAPPILTLSDVTDADKTVTVNAKVLEKNAWAGQVDITVTNDENATIQTGPSNAAGNYVYTIADFYTAGTTLTATGLRGPVWPTEDPQTVHVVRDVTPPTPAVINPISAGPTRITGTSNEPGAVVTVTVNGAWIIDPDTSDRLTTTVGSDGKWELLVPTTANIVAGSIVQVFLTDTTGNQNPEITTAFRDAIFGAATKVTVLPLVIPAAPVPDTVFIGASVITGTTDPNVNVRITLPGGTIVTGMTDGDGNFSINVPAEIILAEGEVLSFVAENENGNVSTTATTTVVAGDAPVLTINPQVLEITQGSTINLKDGISASDTEDGDLTPEIIAQGTLDSGTIGVQIITYLVTDSHNNTATGQRTYVITSPDEPAVIGTEYVIFANSFTKRVGQVDTSNAAVITAAHARAYKISDAAEVGATIADLGGYTATAGAYNIVFNVADEVATEITSVATVTAGSAPVLTITPTVIEVTQDAVVDASSGVSALDTEDGDLTSSITNNGPVDTTEVGVQIITYTVVDSDGNTVTGTRSYVISSPTYPAVIGEDYVIFAGNFTKRIGDVVTQDAAVITAANAKSYSIIDGLEAGVGVTSLGGYTATAGSYNITFNVQAELATQITTVATVTAGEAPVLTITPTVIEVTQGSTVDVSTGVSALDTEDGDLTSSITNNGPVNTTEVGVQIVTYTVVDSDGNTAIANRTYVISSPSQPVVIGDNYAIFASDFTKRVGEVDTLTAAVISAASAKAYNLNDATEEEVSVADLGGYTASGGTYTITFNVATDITTEITAIATVTTGDLPVLTITPAIVEVAQDSTVDITTGVSALDTEDGDLTTYIINNGPVDTTAVGVQIVTYTVVDSDGNTATGNRTYVISSPTQPAVIGDDYVIFASSFTKRVSEVDTLDSAVISAAGAKAYNLTDGLETTVAVTSLGGYTSTVGTYNVTFNVEAEVATEITAVATVTAGDTPVLTITPTILEVMQGSTVDESSGVSALDTEDGDLTSSITNNGPVDTTEVGVQIVTYTVVDGDGNTATGNRTYVISSPTQPAVIGDEYVIFASYFTKRIGDVITTDTAVITAANAKAYNLTDGLEAVVAVADLGGYTATAGAYNITFNVEAEVATEIVSVATVTAGDAPVLTITPTVIEVAQGSTVDVTTGVSALDTEDGDLTSSITNNGPVDTTEVGVQIVTYTVVDNDGNIAAGIRTYVISSPSQPVIIGDNYAIFASNFTKRVGEVETLDAAVIAAASAKAYNLNDATEVEVSVADLGGYTATVGIYNITFNVTTDVVTEITVVATVTAGDTPVLTITPAIVEVAQDSTVDITAGVSALDTEDGDLTTYIINNGPVDTTEVGVQIVTYTVIDSDGNTATGNRTYVISSPTQPAVIGDEYVVFASNFTKRVGEVDTLDTAVINAASAKAYNLTDGLEATVAVTSLGGYTATVGTYNITFNVEAEVATEITSVATVTAGDTPVLTITPTILEVTQGSTVDASSGVSALDTEDGDLTSSITNNGPVDTTEVGVQIVTYTVVDSDGNTVTGTRTYVISSPTQPAVIGDEYVIFASDFTKRIADVVTTDAAVITAANAKAYNLTDGLEAVVAVTSLGGYTATAGVYNITFNVEAEVATEIVSVATVTAGDAPVLTIAPAVIEVAQGSVVDVTTGVSALDTEDGDLTSSITNNGPVDTTEVGVQIIIYTVVDSDGNTAIGNRTYVISSPTQPAVIGDEYVIFASSFTKRVGEVDTLDAAVINAASTKAYNLADGLEAAVAVASLGGYTATVGTYTITFNVTDEATTEITAVATVTAGDAPVLTITPAIVEVTQGSTVDITTGVSALDTEDGSLTSSITNNGPVDTTEIGVQIVTYTVVDSDGNTATGKRTYVISSPTQPAVIGDEYVIFASDFTKRVGEVDTLDAAVINAASAKAYNLTDGLEATVAVANQGGYTATAGTYNVTFNVEAEVVTEITSVATVTAGDTPVLTITPLVVEVLQGSTVDANSGVSALDTEDGDLTSSIINNGPVDTTEVGVQIVTYTVVDSDGNTATGNRTYVISSPTQPAVIGDNFVIFASNFTKRIGDVVTTDAAVITAANAKAYNLTDGLEAVLAVTSLGGYTATAGAYNITFNVEAEVATEIVSVATVTAGDAPVLTITPTVIEVTQGSTVDVSTGVSALDTEDGDLTSSITNNGPVDTTEVGVQIVTYTVVDSDGNTAIANRTYVISSPEQPVIISDNYAIFASNFTKRVGEVDTLDVAIISAASAKAYNLNDATEEEVSIADLGGYTATVGTYTITFNVTADIVTEITSIATVTAGDTPVLTVTPTVVEVTQGSTVDVTTGVSALDTEDGDLTNSITNNGPVNTTEVGVQIVTYTVIDSDGNTATRNRTYVISSPTQPVVIGEEYVVFASDFTKRVGEVDTLDAAVINAASAKAYNLTDGLEAAVTVTNLGGYTATVGVYTITFNVTDEVTIEITAVATVTAGDNPVLTITPAVIEVAQGSTVDVSSGVSALDTEDGDLSSSITNNGPVDTTEVGVQIVTYTVVDSDGNTVIGNRTYVISSPTHPAVIGDEYVIFASNFTKRVGEVDTLEAAVISAANAKAYSLTDGLEATVVVTTLGGYIATAGAYNITFNVEAESSTEITIVATVIAGDAPVLTVTPTVIEITQGSTVDITTGVSALDTEDGDLTNSITNNGPVDTTEIGVQIVTYTVVDSDGNTATGNRTYVISSPTQPVVIGDEYVIFASSFTKRVGEVDTLEAAVISAASAKAYNLTDGLEAAVAVTNLGGYTATVGVYTITFNVTDETITEITAVATVTAGDAPILTITPAVIEVAQGSTVDASSGISALDTEDGDLTSYIINNGPINTTEIGVQIVTYTVVDSDGNTATGNRTYVISSPTQPAVIGDEYVIFASDFTKRVGEVDTVDAAVINAANTKAYNLTDGLEVAVAVTSLGGYTATIGTYNITFNVIDEIATEITAIATVTTGDTPVLTIIPTVLEITQGSTVDVSNDVSALDTEDGDLTSSITNDGPVDTTEVGVQVVTYTVVDSDGNTATGIRTYVISSPTQPAVIGDDYVIFASNFTKRIGEVDTLDAAVISAANAKAYNLTDGLEVAVAITSLGGYTATAGLYNITFNVEAEPATEITSVATVTTGDAPVLTIAPAVVEVAQGSTADLTTGVSALDSEDGDLTSSITNNGPVDTTEVGVQIVTYTVVDSDGNIAIANRTYVISSPSQPVIIGDNYAIFASSFTKRVGEVDTLDTVVINAASAKAYNLNDATEEEVSVTDLGGYTATVGTYTITFNVTADIVTEITSTATVTAGDAPVLTITPTIVEVAQGTTVDVTLDVSALDTEDGDLTSYIINNGPVDTTEVGVQVVTYTVVDSDGNTATGNRTYVISSPTQPAVIGDEYVIFAGNFTKRVGEVDTSDAAVIIAASAKAYNLTDGLEVAVAVTSLGGYTAVVGTYDITFNVTAEITTETTVVATVTAGDVPVLTITPTVIEVSQGSTIDVTLGVTALDAEDGELTANITNNGPVDTTEVGVQIVTYTVVDNDGNTATGMRAYVISSPTQPVVIGDNYVIFASDFTRRIGDVDVTDAAVIAAANSKAYNLTDGLEVSVAITSLGGYAPIMGLHNIKFHVVNEISTEIAAIGTVTVGDAPVLTITPAVIEVTQDSSVDITTGVSALDTEDGDLTSSITNSGPLDTTEVGVQIITYTVVDSDGNIVTGIRTYVISSLDQPVVIGNNYAIFASNFTKRIGEVDTLNTVVIAVAKARAFSLNDAAEVEVSVADLGGYTAAVGTYSIRFNVAADVATEITSTATVTAGDMPVLTITPTVLEVAQGSTVNITTGVSALDTEDGDLTSSITNNGPVDTTEVGVQVVTYTVVDSDGNIATGIRTYVISSPSQPVVIGNDYVIFASDFTKLITQVDATDAAVIIAANAKVYNLTNGLESAVAVTSLGGYTAVAGTYDITFHVTDEATTEITAVATVVAGDEPVLTITPTVVEVAQGSTVDVTTGVSALDSEDGDLTSSITNNGPVDTTEVGVQIITYTVVDSDGNTTTGTRTYVISSPSQPAVIGNGYVIFASDFTKLITQVDTTDAMVITAAKAKAFNLQDGAESAVAVTSLGGYTAEAGVYDITFHVTAETATNITIVATVTTGAVPVLTINPERVQVAQHAEVDVLEGVTAEDEEDGILPVTATMLDTSETGVQFITYSATDSDGNTVTGTRVYIIGDAVVGTDYAIFAEDFAIRNSLVATSDVQVEANVRAFSLNNNTRVAAGQVATEVTSLGGYKAVNGTYVITFNVISDATTNISITATVNGGEIPVFYVDKEREHVQKGANINPLDGVKAIDPEDGELVVTHTELDTSITGIHFVTYTATDSDGNTITTTKTFFVGNAVIGTDYVIFAEDFRIASNLVKTDTASILKDANVKAFKIIDGEQVAVEIVATGGYTAKEGAYELSFAVVPEPETKINIIANVYNIEKPKPTLPITGENIIEKIILGLGIMSMGMGVFLFDRKRTKKEQR